MNLDRQTGRRNVLALVPAFVLAGCGGGSGSSTGTTSSTGTGSGTTTTPASPTYDLATDFSRDRSFNAIGVRVTGSSLANPPSQVSRVDAESAAIGFTFTAATRTYVLRYNDDALTIATQQYSYSGTNYSYDSGGSASTATITRSSGSNGVQYAGYVSWYQASPTIDHYLLFGARTQNGDLPTTGTKVYTTTATGTSITVDLGARTVTASDTYQSTGIGNTGGSFVPPHNLTMTGVLDPATGRISGTVAFDSAAPSGTFEGALYGPKAAEAALVYVVTLNSGGLYDNVVLGRT